MKNNSFVENYVDNFVESNIKLVLKKKMDINIFLINKWQNFQKKTFQIKLSFFRG